MLRSIGNQIKTGVASCVGIYGGSNADSEGGQEQNGNQRLLFLRESLACYRKDEAAMRARWDRDELENFRKLPARAWPEYQPEVADVPKINSELASNGCTDGGEIKVCEKECTEEVFNLATALVFNNMDSQKGLDLFLALARSGHINGMVAAGVVLVEGLGVAPDEKQAITWLEKACSAGSAQGCFELATAFYNGIEGVLEEDERKSFELFEKAANQGHLSGKFMTADCLLEGIGTRINIKHAIPLLAEAAEHGHRYARQRMRELLDECK
mmetsp:Transcript_10286/g.13500  ORF Transcript_10286/g.13500 Transcript_10286/m.13500 type:complete len:270 (-) Transcript_10286:128-937(-)